MAKEHETPTRREQPDAVGIEGVGLLRPVFPMLARLAQSGTQRDHSGNRRLLFSLYAGLVLVGLSNPVLNTAPALAAASGL